MNIQNQINLLKFRLHQLTVREKENEGVCRKIRRQIRRLEKKLQQDESPPATPGAPSPDLQKNLP